MSAALLKQLMILVPAGCWYIIEAAIELADTSLLESILMLSQRPRWARYKEKIRCDNISSDINRAASSLFLGIDLVSTADEKASPAPLSLAPTRRWLTMGGEQEAIRGNGDGKQREIKLPKWQQSGL